jgi:hypothetical protein
MDKKSLGDLLDRLSFIAEWKSALPFDRRGLASSLGLYVQRREAGKWTRLEAGGRFRSYIDARHEEGSEWEIREFDEDTWNERFAHLVDPTCDIAEYLFMCQHPNDNFDREKSAVLTKAVEHFKSTQEWLGLPTVSVD